MNVKERLGLFQIRASDSLSGVTAGEMGFVMIAMKQQTLMLSILYAGFSFLNKNI